MLCVFPVFAGDVYLLINLFKWIKQLGGCPGHSALIVADAALGWPQCECLAYLASTSFQNVEFITNETTVDGWIPGSNSLWLTAALYCYNHNINGWFWIEPDAVPLGKDWLDLMTWEWERAVTDILAGFYPCSQAGLPDEMLTGVAVYSQKALSLYPNGTEAFDVQFSRAFMQRPRLGGHVLHTNFIQHFWGPRRDLPPTFRSTRNNAPLHAFTLDKLAPQAVLFHRNKDGTLIDLLRAKMGIKPPPQLLVALPACAKDADLLLKCLGWMFQLDGQNQFDCLLSYDPSLGPLRLSQLRAAAKRAFRVVHEFSYPRPPREVWPDACNMAFQSTAQHIEAHLHRPWLWFEADCVPLKPNWLDALWLEYQNCGSPIMGPVIPEVGHMNGTAIYPPDFPAISPRAMRARSFAWDTEMTADIVGKVHDCSRLFCHRWGMRDGLLHPSTGPAAHFSSPQSVDLWLPKDAVIFHRCKDGSLIDQLRIKK